MDVLVNSFCSFSSANWKTTSQLFYIYRTCVLSAAHGEISETTMGATKSKRTILKGDAKTLHY